MGNSLSAARARRLTRFRTTALGETFFETAQATRAGVPSERGLIAAEKRLPDTRRRGSAASPTSSRRESRFFFGIVATQRGVRGPSCGDGARDSCPRSSLIGGGTRAYVHACAFWAAKFVSCRNYTFFSDNFNSQCRRVGLSPPHPHLMHPAGLTTRAFQE